MDVPSKYFDLNVDLVDETSINFDRNLDAAIANSVLHEHLLQPSSPTTIEEIRDENNLLSTKFFPQAIHELKPFEGKEFETWEEAYNFYNEYAAYAGFSTRIYGGKKKKDSDDWKKRTLVCSKEGVTNSSYEKNNKIAESVDVRRRGDTRCECKARLNIIRNKDKGNFIISIFIEYHNHLLSSPSKVHFLRSHRIVTHVARALVHDFDATNVSTGQQLRLMVMQSGGIQKMGFIEKDIRNYKRDKKEKRKGHDAQCLQEYFLAEQEKNQSFYVKMEKDENHNLTKCFLVTAAAREAYTLFGDAVVFDTTYNTNEYCMIFAPLTGVNHHGQTVVLACAFLNNETKESFTWLFNQWLEVFHIPPNVIITDQDPAMIEVVSKVFPNIIHRFCIWHIMNKFPDKLGPLRTKIYYDLFKHSVYNSETREDFEAIWNDALQKSALEDDHWLNLMFSLRVHWVPAYLKDHFHAGMSSSQRAESNHSFFKRYVDKKNSLMLFITRFNMAIERQKDQELRADHIDIYELPKLLTRVPMEEQMRKVYTLKIFQLFQKEVHDSELYYPKLISFNDVELVYEVQRVKSTTMKFRRLVCSKFAKVVLCSCKHFEFKGIPCRHMISYFRLVGQFDLPSEYVLRRWTKSAKVRSNIVHEDFQHIEGHESLMIQKTMLYRLWASTVDLALLSKEGFEYTKNMLETCIVHMKGINLNVGEEMGNDVDIRCSEMINEPLSVKAKGSGNRFKSSKEKAMKKARLCHTCNRRGVGHDSRKCPLLNSQGMDEGTNGI